MGWFSLNSVTFAVPQHTQMTSCMTLGHIFLSRAVHCSSLQLASSPSGINLVHAHFLPSGSVLNFCQQNKLSQGKAGTKSLAWEQLVTCSRGTKTTVYFFPPPPPPPSAGLILPH